MTDKNYDDILKLPVVDMTIEDIVEYLDIVAVRGHGGDEDVQRTISEIKSRFMMEALYNVYAAEGKVGTSAKQQIVLRAEAEKDTDENTDEINDEVIDILKYGYWESVVIGLKRIKRDFLSLYKNPNSFPIYWHTGSRGTLIKTSCGELIVFYDIDPQALIFTIRLLDENYSICLSAECLDHSNVRYANIGFWSAHKDRIIEAFDNLIDEPRRNVDRGH